MLSLDELKRSIIDEVKRMIDQESSDAETYHASALKAINSPQRTHAGYSIDDCLRLEACAEYAASKLGELRTWIETYEAAK